ncbi:MAG: DUF3786 domain-containing protein [Planctomycetota bacterium]|jgi:hypothetical protein
MDTPGPKPQENLKETLRRAIEELGRRDVPEVARECGGRARGRTIEVDCLGRTLVVDIDAGEVRIVSDSGKAESGDSVVSEVDVLAGDALAAVAARYVMLAPGLPREPGPEVGFADWPDARNYAGPFKGRALGALVGMFGRDPEAFARAAEGLGGERVEIEASGAVAYRLRVFPRVTVTVILHPGDDELPADGQMVFPRGLFEAFAPDDVVAYGELASRALRGRL